MGVDVASGGCRLEDIWQQDKFPTIEDQLKLYMYELYNEIVSEIWFACLQNAHQGRCPNLQRVERQAWVFSIYVAIDGVRLDLVRGCALCFLIDTH